MTVSQAAALQVASVLNVLLFLNTSNIELVDAPVERRLRKRIEKRGWNLKVSQIVKERHSGRRKMNYEPPEPGSSGIEHNHAYKVRAHVRHMQAHTRSYQNRPDLVKPCPRHGACRMIGVRAHFRGLDKPYIEKTRIVTDTPE